MNIKYCKCCASFIEEERLQILPDTVFCSPCAQKIQPVKPRKGILCFDHKTGGTLQTMSADYYDKNKRYFVPNGARSVVKNFMRG
jgi:hypothetical protein